MRFAFPLIYFILVGMMLASTDTSNEVTHLKNLTLQAELQARSFGARDVDGLIDAIPHLCYKAEFRALQKSLGEFWQVALSNLDSIANDDMTKTILLCSCWFLSYDDFVAFLDLSALLVENGKLGRNIFWWSQRPMEGPLAGFLVRNYTDPRVQDIIIRSQKIFQDQPERIEQYERILTGESRRKLEQFEVAMRADQAFCSNQAQGQIMQKSVVQNITQAEATTEPEGVSIFSADHVKERYTDMASSATINEPEEKKRGFMLFGVIGIISVFACIMGWIFWRHG